MKKTTLNTHYRIVLYRNSWWWKLRTYAKMNYWLDFDI